MGSAKSFQRIRDDIRYKLNKCVAKHKNEYDHTTLGHFIWSPTTRMNDNVCNVVV